MSLNYDTDITHVDNSALRASVLEHVKGSCDQKLGQRTCPRRLWCFCVYYSVAVLSMPSTCARHTDGWSPCMTSPPFLSPFPRDPKCSNKTVLTKTAANILDTRCMPTLFQTAVRYLSGASQYSTGRCRASFILILHMRRSKRKTSRNFTSITELANSKAGKTEQARN